MTTIGITGHSSLDPSAVSLIEDGLREALAPFGRENLTGITCLAKGADQIFAQLVLDMGGRLEVIIPAADYDRIPNPVERARFQALLDAAVAVHRMPFAAAGPLPISPRVRNWFAVRRCCWPCGTVNHQTAAVAPPTRSSTPAGAAANRSSSGQPERFGADLRPLGVDPRGAQMCARRPSDPDLLIAVRCAGF